MKKPDIITGLIALVWFINGFYCKILGQVPRHQEIVSTILGPTNARNITFLIGIGEVMLAIWILSRFKPKISAALQIILITAMNTLEIVFTPDLLLWGEFNLLFAIIFIAVIYIHEFNLSGFSKARTR